MHFIFCPPSNYTFGRDKGQTIRGICYPTLIHTGYGHLDYEDHIIPSHFVTPNTGFIIYGPRVITSPIPSLNPPSKQALRTVFKKLVRLTALRHLLRITNFQLIFFFRKMIFYFLFFSRRGQEGT